MNYPVSKDWGQGTLSILITCKYTCVHTKCIKLFMHIDNYVIHICVRDIARREIKEKMLRERNRRKESHWEWKVDEKTRTEWSSKHSWRISGQAFREILCYQKVRDERLERDAGRLINLVRQLGTASTFL